MIGIYPEQSVPFCHPLHVNVPEGDRPTFFARFITARESVKLNQHIDRAMKAEDRDSRQSSAGDAEYDPSHREDLIAELVAILQITLVDWKNLFLASGAAFGFSRKNIELLPDLFELPDLWDLYGAAVIATQMRRDDLKKSASPSPVSGDGSAPTAPDQAASTSPPTDSPPSSNA